MTISETLDQTDKERELEGVILLEVVVLDMSSYTSRIGQLVLQGFSQKVWPQLKGEAAGQGGGDGGKIHQDFELQKHNLD